MQSNCIEKAQKAIENKDYVMAIVQAAAGTSYFTNLDAMLLLVHALYKNGDYREAVEHVKMAIELNPSAAELIRLYTTKSDSYIRKGEYDLALNIYEKFKEMSSPKAKFRGYLGENVVCYYLLKEMILNEKDTKRERIEAMAQKAITALNKAKPFALSSLHLAKIKNNYGAILQLQKKDTEAINYFNEAIELYGFDGVSKADALTNLALSVSRMGQYSKSQELLKKARNMFRDHKDEYGVGQNLMQAGIIEKEYNKYKEAFHLFKQAETIFRDRGLHYLIAEVSMYLYDCATNIEDAAKFLGEYYIQNEKGEEVGYTECLERSY